MFFAAFAFALTIVCAAQDADKITQVPAEQKMNVEGVVLNRQSDRLAFRTLDGVTYNVVIAGNTEMKEKKINLFRSAKRYSKEDLVPGLRIDVLGTGDNSGAIAATKIQFRNDDLIVAQTMDTRVVPVEYRLKGTETRLSETEQNAQRLSGQVQELSAVSNLARVSANTAQDTADKAVTAANDARSRADKAQMGVAAANERIVSLDDYGVKESTIVHFKAGSAVLLKEDKEELQKFAESVRGEKGFVIEVAGFASSEGDAAFNRRLSQKRADAVIQYLAENYSIPLRRFITPMGYGESQPVADNATRTGRTDNRRVEVRMLVSKGLLPPAGSSTATRSEVNNPTASQLE
jgi:outer membrane protein OmpA-like peptidoglycan-associated protein